MKRAITLHLFILAFFLFPISGAAQWLDRDLIVVSPHKIIFGDPASASPAYLGSDSRGSRLTGTLTLSGLLSVVPGSAPASPSNGDIWTTATGVYARINGSTVLLSSTSVNGSALAKPNFNATTPSADAGYTAVTPVVSGSDVILEFPTPIASLTGTAFQIGLQRGSNLAPAFAASPAYTVSHWTEGAGSMAISYTGVNSFTPTTPITIVIGQTYQVDLVCSAYTSGTFTVSLGGVTSPAVTPAANNQYRFYITATSTTSPTVQAASSGAQAMTFSALTVSRSAYDGTSGKNASVIIDTNSGLTIPLTVYQPPALAGWTFQEYVIAAYAVVVKSAQGTDTWEWGTSTYTGTLTFAAVRQTFLTLVSFVNGYWDLSGINGSVTPA